MCQTVEKRNFGSCQILSQSENTNVFGSSASETRMNLHVLGERRGTGDIYTAWSGVQGEGHYSLLQYSLGKKCEGEILML